MTEDLPRIGAEIAGYRLLSLVTRGGMAVVYLAEDLRLGRKVALKILAAELASDDDFRTRFLRESKTAASIDHPNVIPIYDAGEAEGHLYIAMRHVDDIDLKALLKAEPELEIARATSIASQIAGALGAAHKRDLVHRDVKPANVLIIRRTTAGSFDHVYLSDFGLAKHTKSVSGLTATGHFMGTVNYAAPEQVEGKQVDGRTDIYALGCVLFECLTGRPPFHKEEGVAVIMAHLREPPPSVRDLRPDCPPALAQVVAKTLAKSPDERYQTCEDLIAALQLAAPASGVTEISATAPAADAPADALTEAPPVPRSEDGQPKSRSIPGGLRAALALGLVAIAALAVVLLAGGGGDEGGDDTSGATATVASTTATGTQSDLAWEALPDTPTPRQQAAGAVVDGKAWIVGGLEGEEAATATNRVESYDAKTETWEQGPELPVALHHAVARNYHGELVVIGGWTPEGEDLTANTSGRVFVLRGDGNTGSWEELPELNHPRAAPAAAVVGGELVVVGGQADGQLVPETEIFDGEKWTDAAPMPTPREHLAAASDGTYLYTVGGRELSSSENSGALERYDPAKDEWTSLPPMPNPIGSFDATIAQGRLITVGGELPTDVSGEVQAYELKTQTWSTLPSLATPRHGLTVVVDGSKLYAVDGALEPGHAGSTTVAESLDLATAFSEGPSAGRWRELTSLPTPRQQAAGAVFGGRIWLARRARRHRSRGGDRHHSDLRPGDLELDRRPRPAAAASSRHRRNLRWGARRDRRLDARGCRPDRDHLRRGPGAPRRGLGGAAAPQPPTLGRRRRGRRRQAHRHRRPGGRAARARDRDLRRRDVDRRSPAAQPARAPRGGDRRHLPLRGRRPRARGRSELGRVRALRPRDGRVDDAAGDGGPERQPRRRDRRRRAGRGRRGGCGRADRRRPGL